VSRDSCSTCNLLTYQLTQLLTRTTPRFSFRSLLPHPQTTMSSRRVLKAAEAIREVVGMAILADLKDPRIDGVTVTGVEVTPDMREAKVLVSIMGSEAHQRTCLHGLQSAAGFLQQKIAKRIDTRYTPRLRFELDMGVKKSIAIARLLDDVLPHEAPSEEDFTAEDAEDAEQDLGN
jgi:ribosome-binding factor A